MSNVNFKPMTDEQREEVRLKRLADQEFAKENLHTNYQDEDFWKERASFYGFRMPMWWIPASETKYVRRACKKLSINVEDFVSSSGFSNLSQLVSVNPTWTAFGMVGLCIDYKENTWSVNEEQEA